MYHAVLFLHSWVRWAVVVLGVLAVVSAFREGGAARGRILPYVIAVDAQVILGIALWAHLSPLTRGTGGGATLRFWRLEHPALGIMTAATVHLGNVLLKKGGALRVLGAIALLASLLLALVALLGASMAGGNHPLIRLR